PARRPGRRRRDHRRDAHGRGRGRAGVRCSRRAGVRGGIRGMSRWLIRGALLLLLSFANLNLIWSPDVLPNTLFAWTVVRSGNLDYDEFATTSETDERPDRIDRTAYFFRGCVDRQTFYSNVGLLRTAPRS